MGLKNFWNKVVGTVGGVNDDDEFETDEYDDDFDEYIIQGIENIPDTEKLEDENLDIEATEIAKSDFSERKDKTLYILEMHKTLVDLNHKNKETFKNVVDMTEKDLEKQNK